MFSVVSFMYIVLTLCAFAAVAAITYSINFILLLMPILFVGSLVGLWYFAKMKPNIKWSHYAKIGIIVGVIGTIISSNISAGMFRSHEVRYMTPEDRYELQVKNNI